MPNKNHTTTKEETEHHKTLKIVCEENSLLCLWYKAGIQAIESKYRNRIIVPDSKLFGGSVDFDKALQKEYGRDHRWDYGFEYEGNFIFIEIHPAQTSEIERMIGKVQALSKWLKQIARISFNCQSLKRETVNFIGSHPEAMGFWHLDSVPERWR